MRCQLHLPRVLLFAVLLPAPSHRAGAQQVADTSWAPPGLVPATIQWLAGREMGH